MTLTHRDRFTTVLAAHNNHVQKTPVAFTPVHDALDAVLTLPSVTLDKELGI